MSEYERVIPCIRFGSLESLGTDYRCCWIFLDGCRAGGDTYAKVSGFLFVWVFSGHTFVQLLELVRLDWRCSNRERQSSYRGCKGYETHSGLIWAVGDGTGTS
jgi:hypothetical protein